MGRYTNYLKNDLQPITDGDNGFVGLNQKIDRGLLKPGFCSELVNKRLTRGMAETRPGMVTPLGLNSLPAGTVIIGASVYSAPDDTEWLLLACAAGVYRCRWDRFPDLIPIPDGDGLTGPYDLVQCFSKVLLFRGPEAVPLEWNGKLSGKFQEIDQSVSGTGFNPIPNASTGELVANRLLVPTGRDEVAVSDVLDYTRYDAILSQFRINSGTDELLVRIFPLNQNTVLAFKSGSIHQLSNLYGEWKDNARLDILNSQIGCAARRSVASVGGDVFFLSRTGVYRVMQVVQGKLETAPVPVSDPIEPLINRINWSAASGACAIVWGQYYWLAVPLDGSTSNNAILRYNTVSGHWEGYDEAAFPLAISQFLVTDYMAEKRLIAVDMVSGRVLVMDEGEMDLVDGEVYQVRDLLETRGYALSMPVDSKKFTGVSVAMSTWNPRFSMTALTDSTGVESALVIDATKSRESYEVFGKAPFDPTNANGDFAAAGRADYSVVLPETGMDLGGGVQLIREQETIEPHPLRLSGRWISVRISNNQGRCNVRAVQVTAMASVTTKTDL